MACSGEEVGPGDPDAGGDGGLVDAGSDARAPSVCGDGVKHAREACDDGNLVSGDGCRADCFEVELDFECATPGSICRDVSVCGDGRVSGREACDDRNASAGDGCSETCQVEAGYACRVAGAACRAAACGDGMRVGLEECDDANVSVGDGCDDHCQVEPGFMCTPGERCRATVCGNGVVEGGEQCDDQNDQPYDGCDRCQREPSCQNAACVAICGDGIKFPGEACDDGNTRAGDGCSPTCQAEAGYACTLVVSDTPTTLEIPIVYRDLRGKPEPELPAKNLAAGHVDFENKNTSEKGIVKSALGADKKPEYAKVDGESASTASAASFYTWYHDDARYNRTVADALTFTKQTDGSYVFQNDDFFPLDGRGFVAEGAEPARADYKSVMRNFHFTSELRYWFEYKGGEKLDFLGDDDVWVFVNGALAVDLGGVHGAQAGSVTLESDGSDARFGLSAGAIYEVVVFQAERHTTRSQYKLTLRGFEKVRSRCASVCGDGHVAPDEVCDDAKNDGSYGSCMPGCQSFAPYCGDKTVQESAGEQCDDGNRVAADGCSNSCKSLLVL